MRVMMTTTAAALALVATAPAQAGGLDTPVQAAPVTVAPAPAPSYDWSGFYLGGQVGGATVDTEGAANVDGDGTFYGVHAGYNWDFGDFVVGVEVDYDETDIDLDAGAGTIDSVARLRGRAGYDFGNGLLAYGSLGLAYAEADVGGNLEDTGYLVGVGLNYGLTENWVIGGDVMYHQFDDFDGSGIDVDVTTLSARVSYRF